MRFVLSLLMLVSLSLAGCSRSAHAGPESPGEINSFADCVAAGNKIMRSLPAKCMTADGRLFVDTRPDEKRMEEGACKDSCGNSVCEQIVCEAVGCPCAETPTNCPADCSVKLESW